MKAATVTLTVDELHALLTLALRAKANGDAAERAIVCRCAHALSTAIAQSAMAAVQEIIEPELPMAVAAAPKKKRGRPLGARTRTRTTQTEIPAAVPPSAQPKATGMEGAP